MNIGRILGVGIGTGAALTAANFVKKVNMKYCVDDVYNNDPAKTGITWQRVMVEDGSDMPHDVPERVQTHDYLPSDYGIDY